MAVANTKSTIVTNLDASPVKQPKTLIHDGRLREQVATVEVAAADDDNSVYRFCRLHSSWRVSSIEIFNDAITGGTDYDVGLHDTAENGGAVVDANLFGDAVDLSSARVAPLDVLFEALGIESVELPLWDLISGLTEDPAKWYDLSMTGITVGTAAGTITVRVRYTRGD